MLPPSHTRSAGHLHPTNCGDGYRSAHQLAGTGCGGGSYIPARTASSACAARRDQADDPAAGTWTQAFIGRPLPDGSKQRCAGVRQRGCVGLALELEDHRLAEHPANALPLRYSVGMPIS